MTSKATTRFMDLREALCGRLASAWSQETLGLQVSAVALMCLGVVMVYSTSASVTGGQADWRIWHQLAGRQLIFTLLAVGAMAVLSRMPYEFWSYEDSIRRWAGFWVLLGGIALLAAVYVPGLGVEVNGVRRWIQIGGAKGVRFQPSEFAKVGLVIFLAGALSSEKWPLRRFWRGVAPLCCGILAVCGLVGYEDFGSAALIAAVAGVLLIAGGVKLWHLLVPALPGVAAFAYLVISRPYRLKRLTAFTDIWADPQGAGYHPIQSLIAIGTGGWLGRGLGDGIQKYGYLPEDTTDFIFSIVCEELGVAGGVGVIVLFMLLIWQGLRVMRKAPDSLGRLLALGLVFTIGLQAAMNIAVATVSVPTKGIALPFVSAGGSGLLLAGCAVGIVSSVGVARDDSARR